MNLWISVLLLIGTTCGSKILFLAPINGKSHWLFMQDFIKALLDRHHEVTTLTPITWNGVRPDNYTEVLIDPPLNIEDIFPQSKVFTAEKGSPLGYLFMLPMVGRATVEKSLQSNNVQKFLHDDSLRFDLVILEEFAMDSFWMFAHKFKAPLISICSYGYPNFIDRQSGMLTPWSHVPMWTETYSDKMSFIERLDNTILSLADWMVYKFFHMHWQNDLAKKYFGHLGDLPSLEDLTRNISVVLINTHRSISPPRPSMPGTVFVGGAHIKDAKALPKDLQTFLDDAHEGAIYFSFGTYVRNTEMPPDRMEMILNAFEQIGRRVLWKYDDDETIQNVPKNVMIRKWMPQNDILAHPNVILFISHGGMFGHFEALYRGVPLIIIPFFGDQFRNAKRAQLIGYAKHLDFKQLSTELLVDSVREMISNKSYLNKAREISAIFKDNIVHPMEEAMWWIEHVLKFRGAKHLKSHAVTMTWSQYLLVDVFGALILGVVTILFAFYLAVRHICKRKSKYLESNKKRN
ncbi:hypothetical protein HA402_008889 [Bradysia odoriphaga]|nr:hypothetical protein HA402_008889 [Bradysia odoriphaga]